MAGKPRPVVPVEDDPNLSEVWRRLQAGTPLKHAALEVGVPYDTAWRRLKDMPGYDEAVARSIAANGRTPANHVDLDVNDLLARYLAGESREDLAAACNVSPNTIYARLRVFPEYLAESRRRVARKVQAAYHAKPEAERKLPPEGAKVRALKALWRDDDRRAAMYQTRKERHGQSFFEDLSDEDRAQIVAQFRAHVSMKKLSKRYRADERAISKYIRSVLSPEEFERIKAETYALRALTRRAAATTEIHRPGTIGNARSKGKRHLYRVRVPAIR